MMDLQAGQRKCRLHYNTTKEEVRDREKKDQSKEI